MTTEAFTERIIALEPRLYRVSAGILGQPSDQEDAVQSALERAWRQLSSLRDEAAFESWVVRILINESRTILRKKKWAVPMAEVPDFPAPPQDADPDLYRFFTGLSDKLRPVMTLFYVEGYEIPEIAYLLHLPRGTVKSRLARGREAMRQARTQWKEDEE